jgi:hypothetical protein
MWEQRYIGRPAQEPPWKLVAVYPAVPETAGMSRVFGC